MDQPSFATPCLQAQAILDTLWESPDPLCPQDETFLSEHAEVCPMCSAEIKEQKALIASLSSLPLSGVDQAASDRMMSSVLQRLELNQVHHVQRDAPSCEETTPRKKETISTNQIKWGWAIAACFVGALILAGPFWNSQNLNNSPSNLASQLAQKQASNKDTQSVTLAQLPLPGKTLSKEAEGRVSQRHKNHEMRTNEVKSRQKKQPINSSLSSISHKKSSPVTRTLPQQLVTPEQLVSSISGELLADSTTPDDFIWSASQPVVSEKLSNLSNSPLSSLVDKRQKEAELAVDADQNWSEQGETSLVDFVGF